MHRLLALCLVLTGCQTCQRGDVVGVGTRWTAAPDSLDLGTGFLGADRTAPLTLQNESRSSLDLTLSVDAPFSAPTTVHLEGGAATTLDVHFRPTTEGAFTGTLRLDDGVTTVEVALRGTGLRVPTCDQAPTCHTRRFDPARGECLDEPVADGTSCSSACLTTATCQQGVCLGTARDCDDRNACTADSCLEALGCQHDAITCAPSTDACLTSVCSPRTGCGLEPVADGTSCGANDCTTAHVCIAGTCELRASPEGSECAPADVCRAASVCVSQRCVQGEATPPVARWLHAPSGKRIFFEGTVTADGVAYFTEASVSDPTEPLELVALDLDGRERLRVVLEPACPNCSARLALDPLNGLVFSGRRGKVQARDLRTGHLFWERDTTLGKTLRSPQASDGGAVWSTSAFLGYAENDVIVEQLTEGYELHREYSVAFHRLTGAVVWERDWWGHVYFPLVTGAHQLFVTQADCWAPIQQSLVLDDFGQSVRTVARQARPLTVDGDRVLLAGTDLVWSSPSGTSAPLPVLARGNPSWALTTPGRTVVAGYQSLTEVDDDGGVRWNRNASSSVLTAVMVADGGVLFTEYTSDGGSLLHRITATGDLAFTCPLPGYTSSGTLHRGVFIAPLSRGTSAAVGAFEVGPIDLASHGWVMPNGSPRNDRHPIPVGQRFVQ